MYELLVWGTFVRLLSRRSALFEWLAVPLSAGDRGEPSGTLPLSLPSRSVTMRVHQGLAWLGIHRRLVASIALAALASIIVLDVRGYSFTARRLAAGGSQTLLAIALAAAGLSCNRPNHRP